MKEKLLKTARYFYQDKTISNEISATTNLKLFSALNKPLASVNADLNTLLANDAQASTLYASAHSANSSRSYTPFGHTRSKIEKTILAEYCGKRKDSFMQCYLLGHGHRGYDPGLMRFYSPDSLSPFSDGGLNAYTYCEGDPINYSDPSGQKKWFFGLFSRKNRDKVTVKPTIATPADATNRQSLPDITIMKLQNVLPQSTASQHAATPGHEKSRLQVPQRSTQTNGSDSSQQLASETSQQYDILIKRKQQYRKIIDPYWEASTIKQIDEQIATLQSSKAFAEVAEKISKTRNTAILKP
ncbi:RHS repeat-associated core domain-containing protein [Pseudomonas sp. Teo4]|uniref:RHS repeat-associated core domain-containing protein n=1 Tax=Pseudomonas sp. Teo4 TaxID=3064528 RepID=UPI002ABA0D7C|nr:RHS repeat-associated core domain-containing protein [Pseudomonas sp. Teo4]MDZ3994787.1 hypothetical protein [Pseudomonas sp. Teo4]